MVVLAQRGWQALSGLLTLYLVTSCLGPEDQGYYYTITTLVGLLLALDLGLTNILVPFAAKYAPANSVDAQAFHGIGRYAVRWFLTTGCLMLFFIPIGMYFLGLHDGQASTQNLKWVWVLVVLASTANYMISPYVLLLEGLGKVQEVYRIRLKQGVLSSFLMWPVLFLGGGLLATVVPPLVGFLYTSIWLLLAHPELLQSLRTAPQGRKNWSKEVWPLQWRTGVNVFAGYLLIFVYTPMTFLLFGPKEAGQVGLTMACLNTAFVLAISGVVGKFPRLTELIADGKAVEALKVYQLEEKRAGLLYIAASSGLLLFLVCFQSHPITSRFLDPIQTLGIVIAIFFYMRASAQGYLMRAHLVDYALKLNLLSVVLVVILGLITAYWIGTWGIPLAMLIVFAGLLAPSMSRVVVRLQ